MAMEDDYGMIDGIINNGSRRIRNTERKRPSVLEQLKRTAADRSSGEDPAGGRKNIVKLTKDERCLSCYEDGKERT